MTQNRVYRGNTECPKCGSRETGTTTIATSEQYITFTCDGCSTTYQVRAARVSSLSRTLAGFRGKKVRS